MSSQPENSGAHLRSENDGSAKINDCAALLRSPESNIRLMLNRQRSSVKGFLESLEERGYNTLQRQLVADLAGLDPFSVESSYRASPSDPAYAAYLLPTPLADDVGLTDQRRLEQALNRPSVDEWFREVEKDPSVLGRRWALNDSSDLGITSVLGHALRRRGAELQANLDKLPRGSFGLHELAVAIEVGMPRDRFLEALDLSNADPRQTWRHYRLRRDINLAVIAVFNMRPEILRALMDQGVEPSSSGYSVLDEVAFSTVISRASLSEVVRQLVQANDQPFFPSTIEVLKRRFPGVPEPELHPDAILALAIPGIEDAGKRLALTSEELEGRIAEARRVEEQCREGWLAAEDVPTQTLAAKIRYEEELSRKLDQVAGGASLEAKSVLAQADLAFLSAIGPLREALSNRKWPEVLRLAEETFAEFPDGAYREDFYAVLITFALRSDAPMDVLRVLIDRNDGLLPPYAVMAAAGSRDGSVAMAEQLEQLYELDVHFVDDRGRNAVSAAVERLHDPETAVSWLNYLMTRSVTTKPSPLGLDPLDKVLLAVLEDPVLASAGVRIARLLIDNGASIELSHRQVVEQIRATRPEEFEFLVDSIPVLTPS